MSQTAYLVSCEVLCGEGSDGDLAGMESAHVVVGVHASSEAEAMTKIEADFEDEGYALVDVEWISEASKMEWHDAEGEAEGNDIIARLNAAPSEVVHGSLFLVSGDEISAAA